MAEEEKNWEVERARRKREGGGKEILEDKDEGGRGDKEMGRGVEREKIKEL